MLMLLIDTSSGRFYKYFGKTVIYVYRRIIITSYQVLIKIFEIPYLVENNVLT